MQSSKGGGFDGVFLEAERSFIARDFQSSTSVSLASRADWRSELGGGAEAGGEEEEVGAGEVSCFISSVRSTPTPREEVGGSSIDFELVMGVETDFIDGGRVDAEGGRLSGV